MAKQTRPAKKAVKRAADPVKESPGNAVEEVMRKAALKAMSQGIQDQDELRKRIAKARREFLGKE